MFDDPTIWEATKILKQIVKKKHKIDFALKQQQFTPIA